MITRANGQHKLKLTLVSCPRHVSYIFKVIPKIIETLRRCWKLSPNN
jgi:iron only hydrogenase large subunit-like protein